MAGGTAGLHNLDGKGYISSGNDLADGVWLAPLPWNDSQNKALSSLLVPKRGVVK